MAFPRSVSTLVVGAIIALVLPCVALAAGGETQAWSLPTGTILPGAQSALQQEITGDAAGTGSGTARVAWLQGTFLARVAKTAIAWSAALAVIFVIVGAYQYFAAAGDTTKVATGHKTITWALSGLLIMLLAYAIVQIVTNLNFEGDKPEIAFCNDDFVAAELAKSADRAAVADMLREQCTAEELDALNREYYRTLVCTATDVEAVTPRGRQPAAELLSRVCTTDSLTTLQSTFSQK